MECLHGDHTHVGREGSGREVWRRSQALCSRGVKAGHGALRAGDVELAKQIVVDKMRPLYPPVKEGIQGLVALQLDVAKQEYAQAASRSTSIHQLAIGSLVIGLVLAAWMGFVLIRSIIRPLDAAVKVARGVAEGDLTQRIEVHSTDEIGQLMQALHV